MTLRPHSSKPSMNAVWRSGLELRMSRPTTMCLQLYFLMRYVAVALPIRYAVCLVRSGVAALLTGSAMPLIS